MCYLDRTFCKDDTCKDFNTCEKALTVRIREDADKWWKKSDPPIAIYTDRLECYKK